MECLKEIENSEELEKKISGKNKKSYVSKVGYDAILMTKDDLQQQIKQREADIAELKKEERLIKNNQIFITVDRIADFWNRYSIRYQIMIIFIRC